MRSNHCCYTPITMPMSTFSIQLPPDPRKVSQKERRKKARYRRSQGIRTR